MALTGRLAFPGRLRLTAALVVILALAAGGALAFSGNSNRPSSTPAPLRLVGPTPGYERIQFSVVLRLPGEVRLGRLLAGIENPRSPEYRHFISPGAFGERFGISRTQLTKLEHQLGADGLTVLGGFPQRTELSVSGTVATIEALLHVRMETYVSRSGVRSHAPIGTPVVPAALSSTVQAISGLDSRPRWLPHDVPMGGITPALAASAYDIAPLHTLGVLGQGETIGIVSFSAFDPSDPAAFAASQGISGPPPRVVSVDGGTTDTSGSIEANLDIDTIRAVAPQAQVDVYELPQTNSAYSDGINAMVANHITIISSSWGQCELEVDSGEHTADTHALAAAVAAGVTMFVASGDSGAYDCQAQDPTDHQLSVDWPAASADAVAVGGTRLYLNGNGAYIQEAGWEDTFSAGGGGGGLTTGDARPSWQVGPGVINRYSNGKRELPDVSAAGDPGTPWAVFSDGQAIEVGGTSAATPFWAGSMLLVTQYAADKGIGRLGFVDPILYALADSTQPFPPFHDITLGGNRYYQATPGWDYATGLGSPDVFDLARDMVAYLRAHGAT